MRRMAEKKGGGILKWVLLIGCGGVLLLVLACGGAFLAIFGTVRTSMLSSAAYEQALEIARPDIEAEIGTPFEEGYFVTGSINNSGGRTEVDMSVPLKGPRGEATLYIVATCYAGTDCDYADLTLVSGGDRIDLLEGDGEDSGETY